MIWAAAAWWITRNYSELSTKATDHPRRAYPWSERPEPPPIGW